VKETKFKELERVSGSWKSLTHGVIKLYPGSEKRLFVHWKQEHVLKNGFD